MKLLISCVTLVVAIGSIGQAAAQEGIKRTPLGSIDFPQGYQTVKGLADIAKGTCSGRHTHPGLETSYVLEGVLTLKFDNQPDQIVKPGEPLQIPQGVVHNACALSDSAVRVLTVHIVEQGKPLGSPAP